MAVDKKKGDTIDNKDVLSNNSGDAALITKRYTGLAAIWGNPNAGITTCTRQQTYAAAARSPQYKDATNILNNYSDPTEGTEVKASDVKTIQDVVNAGADLTKDLTGTLPKKYTAPAATASITASSVNNVILTLRSINEVLGGYDTYFANGLCNRSCQVACQTSCQTACQSCNTAQCHNQKCGAH